METDGDVEKTKNGFPTSPCKTLLGFATFPQARRRSNQNNKTGHFICYRNRTFLFAPDTLIRMVLLTCAGGPRRYPMRLLDWKLIWASRACVDQVQRCRGLEERPCLLQHDPVCRHQQ